MASSSRHTFTTFMQFYINKILPDVSPLMKTSKCYVEKQVFVSPSSVLRIKDY